MPLIYTNVIYAFIFWLSLSTSALSEIFGPAGPRRHQAGARKLDRGSLLILNISALLGIILYFILPFALPAATVAWNQPLLFISGFLLLGLGMSLRRYAMAVLGRFFVGVVQVQADQQVVQDGPYRLVRHPAYSGMLLATVGVGMMMTNWGSLLALIICLLVGLLYRIKVEEQELLLHLGQSYKEYMSHTKRLIPFIF